MVLPAPPVLVLAEQDARSLNDGSVLHRDARFEQRPPDSPFGDQVDDDLFDGYDIVITKKRRRSVPATPSATTPKKQRRCACAGGCLKDYCDCFKAGRACGDGCGCVGCGNGATAVRHVPKECDACTCRRSRCQKKYCECFAAGRPCGPKCRCVGCCNDSPRSVPNPGTKKPVLNTKL